jgi:integrase
MTRKALTALAVEKLKPNAERREVPDPGCANLYVIVQPSGKRRFAVRYRFAGKPRKLTLTAGISLAAARKAATSAMNEVEEGRDPAAAKQEAKQAAKRDAEAAATGTLKAVCENYMRREGKRLRSKDGRQRLLERLVFLKLGSRQIADIRRSEIVHLLDDIEDNSGRHMAHAALAVLRKIMSWHATRDDDFRSPIVRGMGRVNAKESARDRVLSDDELRAVWRAAEEDQGVFGAYVKFLLLTSARRTEAAAMRWSEISGSDWLLPAARNKTKVDLLRPLSKAAMAVLDELPRVGDSDFVFSFTGECALSGISNLKCKFDAACDVLGWRLHDLRRTARSLMSRAGVNADHAERCLGHVIGGVRGIYDRHQYQKEMLEAYEALAAQIERIVHRVENVVPLRTSEAR